MNVCTKKMCVEDWIKRSSYALALALFGDGSRAAQLPIPCLVHTCGTTGPSQFVTSGSATAVQAGNSLTVQQSSSKAILNWSSFNVSADGKVVFNQPTATSIALNRIFDVNPSTVFGSVSANGQIYLINPNGFVFGSTAKVNVSGLIASSLGIGDSTFTSGLLAPQLLTNGTPALTSNAAVLGANGTPAFDSSGNPILGSVTVAAGAQITANSGGRIMLAAPLVQNAGSILAPDGQVVLAAGQNVYLQASNDPALRGLIVEVDGAGKAWNQLTGSLSAPRGNISLVGLAVNQDGRISATTTVSANGSVSLEAGGGSKPALGGAQIASTQGGTLELGPGSSIDILPELNDTATAVIDQPQLPSTITMSGQQIFMHGGEITAPAGTLKITASANPSVGVVTDGNTDARVRIDAGTKIDLSGSTAELPMSANLVAVQLRGPELANDPTQRNGALRGQTVYVDARADAGAGTPIADVSSAIKAVPLNIAQRTETGGSAIIESEGDVVVQQGVSINVSGGKTVYDGGVLQTTQLVGANGKLYDIGSANPLLTYTGVLNPTFTQTFNKWGVQNVVANPGLSHYEAGYVQGAKAGSLTFAAPSLVLNGTLIGHVDNGPFQRTDATRLSGGTLTIGLSGGLPGQAGIPDFLSPSVEFTNAPFPVVVDDAVPLPAATLELPVDYLLNGGFTNTAIYSNSRVSLPGNLPLQLIPGSALTVQAPRIDIFSDITALGGILAFQSVATVGSQSALSPRSGISIGDGVTLDVRGQWTNDSPTLNTPPGVSPTLQNGGSIALELTAPGSELVLGGDVSLRASGGAWINSANQMTAGKGGTIALLADPAGSAFQVGPNVAMDDFGAGTAAGGTLDLSAPRLALSNGSGWTIAQRIDDTASPNGVFAVYAPLFSDYGFSNVNLSASGLKSSSSSPADALTVTAGTQVVAQAQSLQLNSGYLTRPTGGTVASFAHTVVLPEISRPAESVTLTVATNGAPPGYAPVTGTNNVGLLDVQAGASITVDPGAAISLAGVGGVSMNGTLRAPGGKITLQTLTPNIPTLDPGYVAGLTVDIGANAILDVSGTAQLKPNDAGLRLGSVLTGGTIDLFADRGSVVTEPGSKIDFSGSSALLDVQSGTRAGHYTRETVASAGGALNVHAPESIALLGSLRGTAGVGQLGQPDAGSLDIVLSRSESWYAVPPGGLVATFPNTPRIISIVSSTAGSQPSVAQYGVTILGADQLLQSGIDSLRLEAGGNSAQAVDASRVEIDTNVPLNFVRQITLDAPVIAVGNGYDASLSAASIAIGNSLRAQSPAATTGDGNFNASAQHLDLFGSAVFNGTKSVTLTSAGDILLRGVSVGGQFSGSLTTGGDLTLNAARIYPATGTAFSIISTGAGSTVGIGQSGVSPGVPLSAAGSITIAADNITSTGTLLAPFGSIDLEAGKELTLGSGSLTSVSADGAVIPYGNTQFGGKQWVYTGVLPALPTRQVTLHGPDVTVAGGAVVDLRGGGDLYAYEWVPGTGGTVDRLSNDTSTQGGGVAGLYAIVPSMMGQYAPFDPVTWAGSSLAPGTSVYLSGGGGIAAGVYPLLPARYALLPGAQLVQVESGYQNIVPGQGASLPNGTPVVAGYLTFGNTGNHPADYTAFAIWPTGYAHTIAGYQDSVASTFFAPAATAGLSALPADAGRLSISVGAGLHAAGDVLTAAASTGHSAEIDISASALDVTAQAANPLPGAVDLPASVIQGWNPGTLILGGRPSPDESSIAVSADTVTIGAGVQLSADQIVLVANSSIDLQAGATLMSTSATKSAPLSAAPILSNIGITSSNPGGAAFLAVSDQALLIAQRSLPGTASGGMVEMESGATLATRGALSLDAPGGAALSGTVSVTSASVSLSSSSIGILTPGAGDALVIDANHIDALNQAGQVRLASQGAIDIGAPFTLGVSSAGTPTLTSLTLIATGLNALAGSNVELGAQSVTLQGANAASAPILGAAGGTLGISAGELDVGPGTFVINGFAHTSVAASGAVVGRGSGSLIVGGDLSVNAPQLTAAAASNTLIDVPNGTLTIGTAPALGPAAAPLIGGSLAFAANRIQDDGVINVQGGLVSLQSAHDLNLGPTASINAGGSLVNILGQSIAAAGGAINLSAGGNVDVASGSTLNVAAAGTGSAGALTVLGRGTVTLQGQLSGNAGSTATGGRVSIDAGQLGTDLNTLSAGLSTGGFTNQISVHTQSGDLNLAAANALTANQVILTADTGTVRIDGTITAPSAGQRGQIGLFGGASVQIDGSAALHADGAGATGLGGQIELGTGSSGTVSLASGSVVTALGSQGMGTLLIRAPESGASDVAISSLPSNLRGVGQVLIEPISTFAVSAAPTAADFSAVESSVAAYMSAAGSAIASRLNASGSLPLVVRPAVDLTATGNLTFAGPLDLSSWRSAGQPVDLTVRAAGSINIDSVVSDGFVAGFTSLGKPSVELGSGPSASLRFVAGAAQSPNPLGLNAGSGADLTLASGAIVRTGTGDLDLVAARDVVFGPGSSAYTAGLAATAAIPVPSSNRVFSFPSQGGNVLVSAGRDIQGAPVSQSIADWQVREGNTSSRPQPVQWGVDLNRFGWNIGALGGGDVRLTAARDILNVSAAASDSEFVLKGAVTHINSGGLEVSAGGDVGSGQFYVADGIGTLRAGGAFSAVRAIAGGVPGTNVGSLIALNDAQVSIQARLDIDIDAVVNPTTLGQDLTGKEQRSLSSGYFTYGEDSSLSIQSTAGSVLLQNLLPNLQELEGIFAATGYGGTQGQAYPASLTVRSLQQDITINGGSFSLFPSADGQLELTAGRDIVGNNQPVIMSDALASALPTPAAPGNGGQIGNDVLTPFAGARHASDALPALVTAGRDITSLNISLPKAAQVSAGRDIADLTYAGQNLNPLDLTVLSAGRDFIDSLSRVSDVVQLGGPGAVDVVAGRNVDLGLSAGITTIGNLKNPNLAMAQGADLTVVAGLTQAADFSGFLKTIIEPSTVYQQSLVNYVETQTGESGLTPAQANDAFTAFTVNQQRALIDQVFFGELLLSGREANAKPGAGFTRGYAAIDALFPMSRTAALASDTASPYAGDLSLTFSRLYTISGGGISLLVPGGQIDVGLANPPPSVPPRQPSQLGIVAQGAGDVDIYSKSDVLVNASRIFTLGGGNILIWSDQGSIDAGRGSKSSLSVPPPQIVFDALGNATLSLSGAVAGSGIRTIQIDPSVAAGNVDLVAPVGTVNAGDAGIGAAGNINIAAQTVLGASNINFGGSATGVPAQVSNIGASLAGASAAAGSATNAATASANQEAARETTAPLAQTALSWLDVFVTGLGEENCKPEDLECLKRQIPSK
jgi:filamentous hemagglutinin